MKIQVASIKHQNWQIDSFKAAEQLILDIVFIGINGGANLKEKCLVVNCEPSVKRTLALNPGANKYSFVSWPLYHILPCFYDGSLHRLLFKKCQNWLILTETNVLCLNLEKYKCPSIIYCRISLTLYFVGLKFHSSTKSQNPLWDFFFFFLISLMISNHHKV